MATEELPMGDHDRRPSRLYGGYDDGSFRTASLREALQLDATYAARMRASEVDDGWQYRAESHIYATPDTASLGRSQHDDGPVRDMSGYGVTPLRLPDMSGYGAMPHSTYGPDRQQAARYPYVTRSPATASRRDEDAEWMDDVPSLDSFNAGDAALPGKFRASIRLQVHACMAAAHVILMHRRRKTARRTTTSSTPLCDAACP